MFSKILIANRGEIACRVIRSARQLGIDTVAVYSEADREALHVRMADEAVLIGAAPPSESYLRADRIIAAALRTGGEAIHPGYGFLSENAGFCRECEQAGIVFIGPPVGAIEAMGSKSAAKTIMERAGVPLLPGYHGDTQDDAVLSTAAEEIGYPVMIKAAAGGGGKGMRLVESPGDFAAALAAARRESDKAFGDSKMLVEKFLRGPRHVEVQVFCDAHGNAVYLFERDCSVQRRHQKVIEEAPAPGMDATRREAMGEAAVLAAQAIDYRGAGTVEFLLDASGAFYFMEMNTRLQVEHPVTELITGQDLVEWQLRVAAGEVLPKEQDKLTINGHAFEARIYAEDPGNDFLPVTGTLSYLQPPEESRHVRVDTGVVQGDEVSVHYDPMIAKLVVWDENRDRALARLTRALSEYRISGMMTNIEFLYNVATVPAFIAGEVNTSFIASHRDEIFHRDDQEVVQALPLVGLYLLLRQEALAKFTAAGTLDPWSPWGLSNAWRLNEGCLHRLELSVNGGPYSLAIEEIGSGATRRFLFDSGARRVLATGELSGNILDAEIDGYRQRVTVVPHDERYSLFASNGALQFALTQPDHGNGDSTDNAADFIAPMNGTVVSVLVDVGQRVAAGDALMIMEAMKMEHMLLAPSAGLVSEFFFASGELVEGGATLLEFKAEE